MTEPNPHLPPMGQPSGYPQPAPGTQPVPALPYAGWTPTGHQHRPGILSAVSVISIVVACISFIASLVSGCQSGGLYMMSKVTSGMAATPAVVATSSGPGGTSTMTMTANAGGGTTRVPTAAGTSATTEPATEPTTLTPTSALTASEVAGAVQRSQSASGNKLNAAQLNALTTALQDPNQTLITPGTAWSPVRMANVNPDGSAFVTFSGGFVSLDPQGQITMNNLNMPTFKVDGMTCLLAAGDALASLGLAIFLFIAAIIVMRSSPAGRKMHLIYAVLKIPVAIAGGIALGKLYSQFYGNMGAAIPGGAAAIQNMMFMWALVFAAIGLIYPIALLIVMNSRGVRDYYRKA